MQTYAEMQTEIAKLAPSQRKAMRTICGTSKLDQISVERIGWKTKVLCRTRGFQYSAELGPKGGVIKWSVWE